MRGQGLIDQSRASYCRNRAPAGVLHRVLHVGMRVLHVTVGRVFSSIHLKQQTSEITLVSEKLYVNLWLRELTVGNFSKVFFSHVGTRVLHVEPVSYMWE